jgi:hypothetical protein
LLELEGEEGKEKFAVDAEKELRRRMEVGFSTGFTFSNARAPRGTGGSLKRRVSASGVRLIGRGGEIPGAVGSETVE